MFNFTRPVCGFSGATFTYLAYIICVRLKNAKQRLGRKGQPGGKFAHPMTSFRKPGENIDATRSVTSGYIEIPKILISLTFPGNINLMFSFWFIRNVTFFESSAKFDFSSSYELKTA